MRRDVRFLHALNSTANVSGLRSAALRKPRCCVRPPTAAPPSTPVAARALRAAQFSSVPQHEQVINPIEVSADTTIDYDKLIRDFGTEPITPSLVDRFEKVTGVRAHPLLRRGLYFSHRELDQILDLYEQGKPFYLYTGRGPSSGHLHLGHMIPFLFTRFLQKAFNCPLVIQVTDDEKFFWKDLELATVRELARENSKDIIAFGFDISKTFIFQNTAYMGEMYPLVCEIQKRVTFNTVRAIFGFDGSVNCGRVAFPAIQAAPSFSACFPKLFGNRELACLIPCAIDQDPYFRMTRDVAPRLKMRKPALIHCKFVSALQGANSKMSASVPNSAIFTNDSPKVIHKKIKSFCKSGAPETLAEHREHGANLDEDVAWEYLNFFLEDDEELARIGREYSTGKMTTGEVKKILAECIEPVVAEFQRNRAAVTDEVLDTFMAIRKLDV